MERATRKRECDLLIFFSLSGVYMVGCGCGLVGVRLNENHNAMLYLNRNSFCCLTSRLLCLTLCVYKKTECLTRTLRSMKNTKIRELILLNANQSHALCIGGISSNVCHSCPPIYCDLLVGESLLGQPSIVLHAHRFAFGFSHFIFFSFLFF